MRAVSAAVDPAPMRARHMACDGDEQPSPARAAPLRAGARRAMGASLSKVAAAVGQLLADPGGAAAGMRNAPIALVWSAHGAVSIWALQGLPRLCREREVSPFVADVAAFCIAGTSVLAPAAIMHSSLRRRFAKLAGQQSVAAAAAAQAAIVALAAATFATEPASAVPVALVLSGAACLVAALGDAVVRQTLCGADEVAWAQVEFAAIAAGQGAAKSLLSGAGASGEHMVTGAVLFGYAVGRAHGLPQPAGVPPAQQLGVALGSCKLTALENAAGGVAAVLGRLTARRAGYGAPAAIACVASALPLLVRVRPSAIFVLVAGAKLGPTFGDALMYEVPGYQLLTQYNAMLKLLPLLVFASQPALGRRIAASPRSAVAAHVTTQVVRVAAVCRGDWSLAAGAVCAEALAGHVVTHAVDIAQLRAAKETALSHRAAKRVD